MAEGDPLSIHLLKLSPSSTSEESLDHVIKTLWRTRKTGLGSADKPEIRSLLAIPSLQELDLVVACLRSIIRKSVNETLTGEDIKKLFPPDLSDDIRRILVTILINHQDRWKEETSKDQPLWQRTRVSQQGKVHAGLSALWSRQDDLGHTNSEDADPNVLPHVDSSVDLTNIPRLKSMTWTMENRSPTNRVAIVTLKLQDYTKSSSGESREIEVKFQLSKDTMEAMLKSMAYISKQFSNSVPPTSEPSSKKQRS